MKNKISIVIISLILTAGVLGLGGSAEAAVDLPWSTTYDCNEWTQSDGLYNVNCDGLAGHGGWTCSGNEEQITSAANYPGGDGGKGQRHWVGDGSNQCSGGLGVRFNSVQSELWIRWYTRYEAGFQWNPLQYDKIIYIFTEHSSTNGNKAVIPAWYGSNSFDLEIQGVQGGLHYSSIGHGWTDTMGGSTSDGQFHCYEVHIKMDTDGSNGICEAWIDGQQIISFNNCDLGTQTGSGWTWFTIGSNQYSPNNGRCMAVDYDDVAVSNTGYIGPLNVTDINPPSRSNSQPNGTLSAGTTSTNISLTTDKQAVCRYSNASNTSYVDMESDFTYTNSTNHSTQVSGLENGKTYIYYVRCNSTYGYVNDDDFNITFSVDGHKADINSDGIINTPELMLFIARWKAGDGVTKTEVEEARGVWFSGGVY
ncbi:MAG: hypothetical protein U9M95_04340 [Candidatus Altiarchaeota archaeon]|nr:hypothetical protein [Candidatus Altiarchaeota archaeon]